MSSSLLDPQTLRMVLLSVVLTPPQFREWGFSGAAKSQLAEAAVEWREACWWDHSKTSRMIHSLTFGMLTPQREGREWGASRSQRAALAWKRALLVDGEITAEARAESPTKSGIRGELQRREKASKLRWIEIHLIANVAWKQAKLVDSKTMILTY